MKVTIDTDSNWSGKWIDNKYIAHIPGKGPEEASVKENPRQPLSEAQRAQMQIQNSRLTDANKRLREVKSNPEELAVYRAQFAAYCAEHGETYVKRGKRHRRRFIDYLRREIMLEMSGGSKK